MTTCNGCFMFPYHEDSFGHTSEPCDCARVHDAVPIGADVILPAPGGYRSTDPITSFASAVRVAGRTGSQRVRLLHVFASGHELTAEQAASAAFVSLRSCYWKRCSELVEKGLLEPTGETRESSLGGLQRVLRITDRGHDVVRWIS